MKALKIIGLVIIFLVAIAIIVPYFLPDNVSVSEKTTINATPQLVFRQVNKLSNWKSWSPFESDTTMVDSYAGPEQGVGAIRSWTGDKVGDGEMTILESDPYSYIRNKLAFGPDGGGGVGTWNFANGEDGTEVTWNIRILDMGYLERWFGLFANMTLKPMMKKGLNKLKETAEAMPVPPKVKKVIMDPEPTLVIFDSATMEGMNAMFESNYNDLMSYIKKKQIPITGKQFAVYHNWNPEGYTRISVGVPVDKKYNGTGNIQFLELPGGEAVYAMHIGGYNTAAEHYAIEDYIKDYNLKTRDFIWETYSYNPNTDTDSTTWKTQIFYPIIN